jgi:hypothetical protein
VSVDSVQVEENDSQVLHLDKQFSFVYMTVSDVLSSDREDELHYNHHRLLVYMNMSHEHDLSSLQIWFDIHIHSNRGQGGSSDILVLNIVSIVVDDHWHEGIVVEENREQQR